MFSPQGQKQLVLTTSVQHCTESSSQWKKEGESNKMHPD